MPNPKPRSYFLPIMLIVVGFVICAGLVLVFVPTVQCNVCAGIGTYREDLPNFSSGLGLSSQIERTCIWCSGRGSIRLLQRMTGKLKTLQ